MNLHSSIMAFCSTHRSSPSPFSCLKCKSKQSALEMWLKCNYFYYFLTFLHELKISVVVCFIAFFVIVGMKKNYRNFSHQQKVFRIIVLFCDSMIL